MNDNDKLNVQDRNQEGFSIINRKITDVRFHDILLYSWIWIYCFAKCLFSRTDKEE
ncbi:hypothetical protein [Ammoniphilus sp. 3BR4]|uniref:hypothetical protein n=1 Tax=Ammoniphilus sp. 3BR4 TaxID=3158265 RepID=UPI0034654411